METEWTYAQIEASDALAKLHHFSMTKIQDGQEIEFTITVHEHIPGDNQSKRFVTRADKQTNQRTAPFTPTGWGHSLSKALSECLRAVHMFPYEGDELSGDD